MAAFFITNRNVMWKKWPFRDIIDVIRTIRKCLPMLYIGLDLTMELHEEGMVKKYKGKIADLNDAHFYIYYPINIDTKKVAFLPPGTKLTVFFTDENSASYCFRTEVNRTVKDSVPLVELTHPGDQIKRVQRREYVRVEAAVEISFHFPERDIDFSTFTDNISAGGCAAILPDGIHLQKGDRGTVDLSIKMESGKLYQLTFHCVVIRIFTKGDKQYISIKYANPDEKDQQILTKFCFERQLAYRRKGYWH